MTARLSDESIKRLTALLDIISPSMQEQDMLRYLANDWASVFPDGKIKTDAMGNIEFSVIRDAEYPSVALIAHTDTICIQITQSAGDGKYRFRSIGASPHMLLGQPVTVINENGGTAEGVIGFDATSQYGQPKGLVFEDLWIDVFGLDGNCSISIGDLAVLKPRYSINGDIISATALDDRLGLFIIGETIRHFARAMDLPVNLICAGSVQEEVGLRGSAGFEFSMKPDAIIVLDVDYATDIPTPHEDQMGRLYLNHGPGLQRKADNSPMLRCLLKSVATKNGLPIQTSLGRFIYGGTDATSLQTTRKPEGTHVCNLTIPCRYMHSPIETASLQDVANAIEIICCVLKEMGSNPGPKIL